MTASISRVAITGAAGYCARGLIQRLEDDDAIELVLAIDVRPLRGRYTPKVVFHQQDVADPMAEVLSANGVEAIVHLAYVLRPGHNRDAIERINVGGTANVLDACAEAGLSHILYLSSTSVYGAHPENPALLTEESPTRPVKGFQYSEDKVRSEGLINEYTRRSPDFKAAILRVCPIMGPNADNFIAQAFSKPFLVGMRGYDPPMQFMHEDDLADIMRLCLLNGVSGVYNLAGEGTVTWSEMARMFGRRRISLPAPLLYGLTELTWGLRIQRDSPASGLNFIRYPWSVSTEKIKNELGIKVRFSSREAWGAFARRQRDSVSAKEG